MSIPDSNKLDTTVTQWRKSSYSTPDGLECVEVSVSNNAVGVRDSHHPQGAVLAVDRGEWTAFVDDIRAGQFRPIG